MKLLKLVPADTKVPFLKFARVAIFISVATFLGSVILFFTVGLNLGIDFRGGTLIQIQTQGPADIGSLRGKIGGLGLGDVQIQEFGAQDEVLIRIEQQSGGEEAQQGAIAKIKEALGSTVSYRRTEVVGPTVSGELARDGTIAVFSAILAILIYIWFRFEWQFAVGAVIALVHDVGLTIGIFTVLQLQFDLSTIAALLTIVGYSLNDTVVVYDRVRENLRKYKRTPIDELLNLSINDTLSRTVLTSVTTLLALLALYTLGGEVIRGFVFAMMWGVLVGTYSSIAIASPVLMYLGVKRDWSDNAGEEQAVGKS
ncbi:MAG: protein translocase subunit SecF [Rhodobacteraceae bacterium]|nr:protein translocase subunit SecF [Paracoccaceae bacterium]